MDPLSFASKAIEELCRGEFVRVQSTLCMRTWAFFNLYTYRYFIVSFIVTIASG